MTADPWAQPAQRDQYGTAGHTGQNYGGQQAQPASPKFTWDDVAGGERGAPFKLIPGGPTITGQVLVDDPDVYLQPVREYVPNSPGRGPIKMYPGSQTPIPQILVILQTNLRESQDDDGRRCVYLASQDGKSALRDAMREAGRRNGLVVGDTVMIGCTGTEGDRGPQSKKLHGVRYMNAETGAKGAGGTWAQPKAAGIPQQPTGTAPRVDSSAQQVAYVNAPAQQQRSIYQPLNAPAAQPEQPLASAFDTLGAAFPGTQVVEQQPAPAAGEWFAQGGDAPAPY